MERDPPQRTQQNVTIAAAEWNTVAAGEAAGGGGEGAGGEGAGIGLNNNVRAGLVKLDRA